jgi:DNA-binding transcriptional MerR regulator
VGVSPELLRAWERRYGLVRPTRSPGGYRLYGDQDAARVARMNRALADGLSAAEAARVALAEPVTSSDTGFDVSRQRLLEAVAAYDESGLQVAFDDALGTFGLETLLEQVILPVLVEVGSQWQAGRLEVSQEHLTSNVLRGRLLSLARLWSRGAGPLAVLACLPGEEHDIGLLAFGLVLRSYGWRILFLGADTPVATVAQAAGSTNPAAVVETTFDAALLSSQVRALRRLAKTAPLYLGGPGAAVEPAEKLGARFLAGDVSAAARSLAGAASA